MEITQELIIELPYDPAIPLLGIYSKKKKQPTNSQRYVHPSIDSNTIYNSRDMEATQVPINRWLA